MNETNPTRTAKTTSNKGHAVSRNLEEACRTGKKVDRKRHRVLQELEKKMNQSNAIILWAGGFANNWELGLRIALKFFQSNLISLSNYYDFLKVR